MNHPTTARLRPRRKLTLLAAALLALASAAAIDAGSGAPAHASTALGTPTGVEYIAGSVSADEGMLSAGAGTAWGSTTTSTSRVVVPGVGSSQVTFQTAYSSAGGPFLELTQASSAIGPFTPDPVHGRWSMVYSVADPSATSETLEQAGMTMSATVLDASSGNIQAIYLAGTDGVTIKLVNSSLVPPPSSPPPAPGQQFPAQPDHLGVAIHDQAAVMSQLSAATGMQWNPNPPGVSTVPVNFPGNGGVTNVQFSITYSTAGSPFVELVNAQPGNVPFAADTGASSLIIGYPVADPVAAGNQLQAAGMTEVAAIDFPNFPVSHIYRGSDGITVEALNQAVQHH